MSLKDGSKKMSKSDLSDFSRINLKDEKDDIINKIKKAKTDALPMPSSKDELDQRLETKNLIGIYSSIAEIDVDNVINKFAGKKFSEFKENLSQVLVDKISPISIEIRKLINDKVFLDKILDAGCEKANLIASQKIKEIHKIIGF